MPAVPAGNYLVDCLAPHGELLDAATGTVWQCHLPIDYEDYDALELPNNLVKIGIGCGVMDAHYFRRSPGATEDGPVGEQVIAGRRWIHCANAPQDGPEKPFNDGPLKLMVDKHHSLLFAAGRTITILRSDQGEQFVQVIAARGGEALPPLPEGWSAQGYPTQGETLVDLPSPTVAWFFKDGSSFQGPINAEEIFK